MNNYYLDKAYLININLISQRTIFMKSISVRNKISPLVSLTFILHLVFWFYPPTTEAVYSTHPTFISAVKYEVGLYPPMDVAVADFNQDGKIDLATVNGASVSVLIGFGDGSFAPVVNYPVSGPQSITAADFNNDGKVDLATGNAGSPGPLGGTLSILIGNGNGTFIPFITYSVGGAPHSLISADFNVDGKLDLAVGNTGGSNFSVLLGNGNGTFAPALNYAEPGGPTALAAADFNNDGKPDLATSAGPNIAIRLGNGDGVFTSAIYYEVYEGGSAPHSSPGGPFIGMTVADFNGDLNIDLAAIDSNNYILAILINNGDGTLAQPIKYTAGLTPHEVTAADFNQDNKIDLVITNYGGGTISVFLNNGNGAFGMPIDYLTGEVNPTGIIAAELNGDGKIDVAATNLGTTGARYLSIFFGKGDGTFIAPVGYRIGVDLPIEFIFPTDFNNDGKVDLATNGGILPGNSDGTFGPIVNLPVSGPLWAYPSLTNDTADLNGDGNLDLAIASSISFSYGQVSILLSNGAGTFVPFTNYALSVRPFSVLVADLNADGKLDLVLGSINSDSIAVLISNGDGTFLSPVYYAVAGPGQPSYTSVTITDLNGDGRLDLTTANYRDSDRSTISVLSGNGDGTFAPAANYTMATRPLFITSSDFNNDGRIDLAVTTAGHHGIVVIFLNTTPLDTRILQAPPLFTNITTAIFEFDSNKLGSFECQLDGVVFATCTSPKSYLNLSEGSHTFGVRAIDLLSNVDPTPASHNWIVDITAPTVTTSISGTLGSNGWYTSDINIAFASSDAVSGTKEIRYRINGGAEVIYTTPLTLSIEGLHSIAYWAIDRAENVSPTLMSNFKIDKTTPVIISGEPADQYLYGEAITISFAAMDAVSGIYSVSATLNGLPVFNNQIVTLTTLGSNTFIVSATDQAGNTVTHQKNFLVKSPAEGNAELIALVESYNLQQGISNSLDAKLQAAQDSLAAANAGNRPDTIQKLQAFINQVEAQRGLAITDAQATALINFANRIIQSLLF